MKQKRNSRSHRRRKLRNPKPIEFNEMRQAWGDGRSGIAMYLTEAAAEAARSCVEGEGADLHRKQGEARALSALVRHFSGASQARRVENPVPATQPDTRTI